MPQNVAKCCLDLFTLPQSVAILTKCHKVWQLGVCMDSKIVFVKGRLDSDLHKELKAIAIKDKRSIVYLLNEAVELLIEKYKSAKA